MGVFRTLVRGFDFLFSHYVALYDVIFTFKPLSFLDDFPEWLEWIIDYFVHIVPGLSFDILVNATIFDLCLVYGVYLLASVAFTFFALGIFGRIVKFII